MAELEDAERQRLVERFGREVLSGAPIFGEGEPAEHCFLLERGRVRLVKRVRSSDRSLTVLGPGDLFGEDALLPGTVRSASAVALTDCQVLALDRATFGELLTQSSTEVALRLVAQVVRRLRHAEEQLENAMLRDSPSRVVNTLLRLAATASDEEPEGRALTISPLELSSRVGLDVDTVKRSIQQLRDGGYLHIKDERIILPDLGALRQLYELLGKKEEVRGGVI
ncbi:MAG: Crp/Fnr family transcriptional regulator [Sandaracinaceae bacterium]